MSAWGRIAFPAFVALVAAILLSTGGGAAAKGPGPTPTVDCESRLQVYPPKRHPGRISQETREISATAGPVMFLGGRQWANERFPARKGPHRLKTPIYLDAPNPVTITVASPEGRSIELSVGLDQRGPQGGYEAHGEAVRLEPCDPDAKVGDRRVGRRTPFLAGFRFEANTCVAVTVEVHSKVPATHETAFGFGRENCSVR